MNYDRPMRQRRRLLVVANIVAELNRQSMTVEILARLTGIEMSVLDHRLAANSAFNLDELELIAAALGVPAEALLQGGTESQQ